MDDYDRTPAIGLNVGDHRIPEDDPLIYIQTADAKGFGGLEPDPGFEYTAAWQHDIDETAFEELFNEYATDGEMFEARTPRRFLGYELPFTKKVGEMGVNREDPRHQVDCFYNGQFILSADSADTDPLRYYFPETVAAEPSEGEVIKLLEKAETAIEEDSNSFD